ncbi:DarT ssDNA thymidine ADP-ribosyltransferase family protein [Burkholderia paludis]|uniref:DarT ssDNA thymidine ADP-ribosyltransferase family protein n=1 Tax=Burkholderia paludis TaxID=1506587 RepID=UPI00190F0CE6|nr:DarT ssDNA thymidine ADP-ribosyltransferase family protein [Burkholderia paludis]
MRDRHARNDPGPARISLLNDPSLPGQDVLILLYQLLIVATLGIVRLVAPKRLAAASLIWSALTVFNLFWPPLIALQLIVIWVAYAFFKSGEASPQQTRQPSPAPAAPTAPVRPASPPATKPGGRASGPVDIPGKTLFSPETIDPAISIRPAPAAPPAGMIDRLAAFVGIEAAAQQAAAPLVRACGIERVCLEVCLESASRRLKLERELASRGEAFRQQYRQSYEQLIGLLKEHEGEPVAEPPDPPVVCVNLAQRPIHPDGSIDAAIQRRVDAAVDDYAQFLATLSQNLKQPGLRASFEQEMIDAGQTDLLARVQRFEAGLDWRGLAPSETIDDTPSHAPLAPHAGTVGTRLTTPARPVPASADAGDPVALLDSAPAAAATPFADASRRAIEALAGTLQIPMLTHFTRASNLDSILRHGLCSRVKAAESGVAPAVNDGLRLDGRRDGVSLSIAFPNHRMFFKYRQTNPDERWVVLGIHPAVLWQKPCGFCRRNAADHRIRTLPRSQLTGIDAFRGMFEPLDDLPGRADQNLLAFDPTDPQAEVLVFDVIEPEYIEAIAFDSHETMQALSALLDGRNVTLFEPDSGPFSSRGYQRNGAR